MTTTDWISRIAADPALERRRKRDNVHGNNRKARVLKADTTKRGTARSNKGKASAKDATQGKRKAEDEPKAAAEISDAVRVSQTAA